MTHTTAIRHIFLDMDGVLVDFFRPALQVHNRLPLLDDWPRGVWDIPTVLGISKGEFWAKIDALGAEYWTEMPAYPWTADLVAAVTRAAPFSILSSPSLCAECPTGKIHWLRRHLRADFRDYLFGHAKHHCAKPGALLIDDSDENVDAFRAHGGEAILFPQAWNSNHAIDDPLGYAIDELHRLSGR